jgi:uncharacterized membrane-anchored protein
MRRSATLFILIALAQLVVPAWMIMAHERVMREGEVFKFRTAPIDPRDPFRGEYVTLNFEASTGSWNDPHSISKAGSWENETFYASLGVSDTSGYALITSLAAEPPMSGAYIQVTHYGAAWNVVERVELPFDRYYLEEGDGAKTESMLMPQWNDGVLTQQPLPAYAVVRVYQGEAVIEDLIVGDKSIHEWLKE